MKKLILWAFLLFVGYKAYHHFHPTTAADGAAGNGVELFVGPGCGEPCDEVAALLEKRGVTYTTTDISTPEGRGRGVNSYPFTVIGARTVSGNDLDAILGALAETLGPEVLTPREQRALAGHFDSEGHPQVVLYGTSWCPYCKAQREFFDAQGIPFRNIDVEGSSVGRDAYDTLGGTGYPLVYVGYRRFRGYTTKPVLDAYRALN